MLYKDHMRTVVGFSSLPSQPTDTRYKQTGSSHFDTSTQGPKSTAKMHSTTLLTVTLSLGSSLALANPVLVPRVPVQEALLTFYAGALPSATPASI